MVKVEVNTVNIKQSFMFILDKEEKNTNLKSDNKSRDEAKMKEKGKSFETCQQMKQIRTTIFLIKAKPRKLGLRTTDEAKITKKESTFELGR